MTDRIAGGTLARVLAEHPAFLYECHAVWPASPYTSQNVRAAVDALVNEMPGRVSGLGGPEG